jgi:histidinol-phosphate/aromatic aminotransferase/cobyric acid decarboxylase-like protein
MARSYAALTLTGISSALAYSRPSNWILVLDLALTKKTRIKLKIGGKSIPSRANLIMMEVKRPVVPLIQALKQRTCKSARLFPALPNHMRVTIGKKTEMEAFVSAFRQVMA